MSTALKPYAEELKTLFIFIIRLIRRESSVFSDKVLLKKLGEEMQSIAKKLFQKSSELKQYAEEIYSIGKLFAGKYPLQEEEAKSDQ